MNVKTGDFIDNFHEVVSGIKLCRGDELIMCGDFNINLLEADGSDDSMLFLNIAHSFSMMPIITKPTRISRISATLIDNILLRTPISYVSGILSCDITDHFPIFLFKKNIFSSCFQQSSNIRIRYRCMSENNVTKFRSALENCDFGEVLSHASIDESIESFIEMLKLQYNEHCPIVTRDVSYKTSRKPWITAEILTHVKKRQAYAILYRQHKLPKDLYYNYRDFVTKLIRKSKSEYYLKKFKQNSDNIKGTWKIINDLLPEICLFLIFL